MAGIISRSLHGLWDAKLQVGHSVLTVQESIRLAMTDFRFLTSVMDGRFLLGSRAFFRLFETAFWSRIDREKSSLLRHFLIYRERRVEKYSHQGYFLEPDIKEGLGGLRDLHAMAWTARIYFKCARLKEIKRFPVFSHFGLDRLRYSESFLLKVRNHLHLLAGVRREDRLLLPFQEKIALSLGYEDSGRAKRPERFMRNVYLHLNRIRYGAEEFHAKAMDIIDPPSFESSPERLPHEFQIMKGNVVLREDSPLRRDPVLILKALKEANQLGLFVGSDLIWEAGKTIAAEGEKIPFLPGAKAIFQEIILRPHNPKILRLMLELGLIGLFIPEFRKVRNLAQFTYYHVETVDLHSLRTLEVIHEISEGIYDDQWPQFKEVFKALEHPEWLSLAGLLHDIGKGYMGDHSEKGGELIPGILKRLGIQGNAPQVIPFLVRHHLLLANISQRRDLNEEKTSVQVAQTLQDLETLRLLFLLTAADSLATGPMAGSDWKIMLLSELYFKVKRIIESDALASPSATKRLEESREDLLRELLPPFPVKEIQALMDQVSDRYFLNIPREDMLTHFRLALTRRAEMLSWNLRKLKDAPVTRVVLCAHDRPGLFSKMVGVFTLNNIKVLSANIFTLKNGLAFDIYEVTNPLDPFREEEMWKKIHQQAVEAMEERLPLDDMINRKGKAVLFTGRDLAFQAKRVKVDNEASDFFTLLEVSGGERIGLLYALAKEIFSLGLDIRFAKVNSDREKMTGVFYVRDASGQKVGDESEIERIRQGILTVLG